MFLLLEVAVTIAPFFSLTTRGLGSYGVVSLFFFFSLSSTTLSTTFSPLCCYSAICIFICVVFGSLVVLFSLLLGQLLPTFSCFQSLVVLFLDICQIVNEMEWLLLQSVECSGFVWEILCISCSQFLPSVCAALIDFIIGLLNDSACELAWGHKGVIFMYESQMLHIFLEGKNGGP